MGDPFSAETPAAASGAMRASLIMVGAVVLGNRPFFPRPSEARWGFFFAAS